MARMAFDPEFREEVRELLAPLEDVSDRAMFGGVGFFRDERIFALIVDQALYLKTDEAMREALAPMGAAPFGPLRNFWSVPAELLGDDERLLHWARQAAAVAKASPRAKPRPKPANRPGARRRPIT